jgi:transcription antitermination factor NusG
MSVANHLAQRSVETFLPCLAKISQWKDRQVTINVPLFPGYVFARISPHERIKVMSTPSVIRMLCYNEVPAMVSDSEIENIRLCLDRGGKLEPHQFVAVGDRVRVKQGIFQGLEGFVVRQHSGCRLVATIRLIQQSVALEIEESFLELACPVSTQAYPVSLRAPGFSGNALEHSARRSGGQRFASPYRGV